ncbi:MAG: helix-turn-helix transcriptional regulator [Bacilli bacterium]|nr:helix-turn-helix transcriptional regulator [Bacilli bacterium]MBR1385878.1 helix-turn-helix transcriptional regulator [Bacilli bacterium]
MLEKNIGEVITEAREKANLSQRQLAKLANINNSELSKIESGVRKEPSPKILRKISNVLDVNYSDLMYMIGLGIEVSPLNPFIKDYYSKLKGDELNEAEVNVLGNKQNLEKLVLSCEEKLNDKSIIESERELLQNTIEDTKYQINTQNEIINLIQSLKVKERNKNAK